VILHIIGGGAGQLSAVERCRNLGITTFVTDADITAPGCVAADFSAAASTFDAAQTIKAVSDFMHENGRSIDGILVTGTDQPVLTAAQTAAELNLPYFLDPEHARAVTNKKVMKKILTGSGIPVAPYRILPPGFDGSALESLKFPVVVKPLDSQGQRGVFRLETPEEVHKYYDQVIGFSRCGEILAEEYYNSDEITVSGWVENGRTFILTVTDRVTVENPPSIGVCIAHHYPSKYSGRMPEITGLTERTVEALGMQSGPIYFQFLVGKKAPSGGAPDCGKIIINETAARLGGAYEDVFIPCITGIDILDIMIKFSCGIPFDGSCFTEMESKKRGGIIPGKAVSLQMFFCTEGVLREQEGMAEVLSRPGIIGGGFLQKPGTVIGERLNSTQRAGFFIAAAKTPAETDSIVGDSYAALKITDISGANMINIYDKMFFGNNE